VAVDVGLGVGLGRRGGGGDGWKVGDEFVDRGGLVVER